MSSVHFSPDALGDLEEIKEYIASDLGSPGAADGTIRKIMKSIRILRTHPESGAPLSSIVNIAGEYRFIVSGNYLTFYRVQEANVYIDRILYGRRDYLRILFDDLPDNEKDK